MRMCAVESLRAGKATLITAWVSCSTDGVQRERPQAAGSRG